MKEFSDNLSAAGISAPSFLDDLSPELKGLIIEELCEDVVSLRSLSLVCRTFQALVEPVLYRRVYVRKGDNCRDLLQSVDSRPQRAEFVHVLNARYRYEHRFLPLCMANLLRQLINLQDLILESPFSSYRNWTSEMSWNAAKTIIFQPILESVLDVCDPITGMPPLQNLKKLTLYWRSGGDTKHWTINGAGGAIFIHPSIIHLELSCASVDDDVLDGFLGQGSTPLKTLVLAECNISLRGLHNILSKPNALEHLYLAENRHHIRGAFPGFNNLLTRDHMKFFSALSQQKHSLAHLTYKSASVPYQPTKLSEACEGFVEFTALGEIKLEADCLLLLESITTKFLLPPNLRRVYVLGFPQANKFESESDDYLRIDDDVTNIFSLSMQRYKALAQVSSLETVYFTVMYCPNPQKTIRHTFVEETSKAFESTGKQFVVESHDQTTYIFPDYPYSHPQGQKRTLFDSHTGGWKQWMMRWHVYDPSISLLST